MKNKKRGYLVLALCIMLLVVCTGCASLKFKIGGNSNSSGDADAVKNVLDGPKKSPEELKKNITHTEEVTKDGDIAILLTNGNKVSINLVIEVEFYDASNQILGSDTVEAEGIPADVETAMEVMAPSEQEYSTYKVYIDAEESDRTTYLKDIEVTHNDTGESIAVQAKNNSKKQLDFITLSVVFYQGGKIVGIADEMETDIQPGRAANFSVYYPTDKNYDDVQFDEYKIFLREAF